MEEDGILPLSEPVVTQSGEVFNSISVASGTQIGMSVTCINRSTKIWGASAIKFHPEH
ncbi:hypothetical protein EDD16DRAFT_1480681 [Pisolithus croceorrhizus]|nr:hypothetical protein F5141DRAFT_1010585 [Pisolithus sp. B1]KAI6118884.1 hypothetical protein EDD16DRAFT_1480681 [Pisolithus croceorrhizus]